MARLPVEIPADLHDLTPDVPREVFSDTFCHATERLDRFVGALIQELADRLRIPRGELVDPDSLLEDRGWSGTGRLALAWLLETLETYGCAERLDERWCLAPGGPPVSSERLRQDALGIMPAAAPAYRVFDLCAQALPAVLRGEVSGEQALFAPSTLGLWFDYFSNTNPHYAPNNWLTATALARALSPGACILEVGGGGGSAAEAALAALIAAGKPPARYVFTELQPAFLRRGSRVAHASLPPACELRSLRYDIDHDPESQGLELGRCDAVVAVNTLHLAQDLVPALASLRSVLRPGGALVLGELIRPAPQANVHLELPFTLLEAYRRLPVLDGIRQRPGFLAVEGWLTALRAAGFKEARLLPASLARCVEVYPGFYSGALVATQ